MSFHSFQGNLRPIFEKYRVLRILSMACLIMLLFFALASFPSYYSNGLQTGEWYVIGITIALMLALLFKYQVFSKKDMSRQKKPGTATAATHAFLYEAMRCKTCGRTRIFVLGPAGPWAKETLPKPVPSGVPTKGSLMGYYCVQCHDIAARSNCTRTRQRNEHLTNQEIRAMGLNRIPAYTMDTPYRRKHLHLLLLFLVLFIGTCLLASLHPLLLIVLFGISYLLALSIYNVVNNMLVRYWVTARGLVQRSIHGFRLYRWRDALALLRLPLRDENTRIIALYTESGNIILSPIIKECAALQEKVRKECEKHHIDTDIG